jgi:hypothetical protein
MMRIKVKWLYDNAISRHGRRYPSKSVDKLIQSAQDAMRHTSIACCIDESLEIYGKLGAVWREGSDALAYIDVASSEHDIPQLLQDQYPFLVALGGELHPDKKGVLCVAGEQLRLVGINFCPEAALSEAAIMGMTS